MDGDGWCYRRWMGHDGNRLFGDDAGHGNTVTETGNGNGNKTKDQL